MTKKYHSIRDSKGRFAKVVDPEPIEFSIAAIVAILLLIATCILGSTYIVMDMIFGRAL